MTEITLTISKQDVYEEVAQTTSYTGSKMEDDQTAYQRIATQDEDQSMLERFWEESKNMVCSNLKKMLISEEEQNGTYTIILGVSSSFDSNLKDSMQSGLFSFFVMNITSKWYNYTNKKEAIGCAEQAASIMDDIKRKAFFKKGPKRPTYQ